MMCHVSTSLSMRKNMSFRRNRSPVRPQTKSLCRKWPCIDPLNISFQSKILLSHGFDHAHSTIGWKVSFSFGSVLGVFFRRLALVGLGLRKWCPSQLECKSSRQMLILLNVFECRCHHLLWVTSKMLPGSRQRSAVQVKAPYPRPREPLQQKLFGE